MDGLARPVTVPPLRTAATAEPSEESGVSGGFAAILLAAVVFSVVLLAVSSVPPWTVSNIRTATLLDQWRGPLAAVGISTLFAVGLMLALDAWSP